MIVIPNELGILEEVRHSPLWRNHCQNLADKGLSYARSIAPVDTGEYLGALFAGLTDATDPLSVPGAPAASVGNNCDHALEVEFQQPMRYLVLLRTLDYLAEGS